jgi:hypothetical protein
MRFIDQLVTTADSVEPTPVSATVFGAMRDTLGGLIDSIAAIERLKSALDASQTEMIEQARQWAVVTEVTAGVPDSSAWSAEVRARRVMVSELACALRIPERTAETMIAESTQLVRELPATFQALAEGTITRRHAAKLADHARSLPANDLAAFEDAVLPHAKRLTVTQFDRKARQVRERTHSESIDSRHREAVTDRSVTIEPGRDGMAWLTAHLPAAVAQGIYNRLTDLAHTAQRHEREGIDMLEPTAFPATPFPPTAITPTPFPAGLTAASPSPASPTAATPSPATPTRTVTQLRADIFADLLADGQLIPSDGTDDIFATNSIRPTVLITVPVLTLLGHGDEPAMLEGHGPIDYDTAVDLVGSATGFIRLLTHPETGTVLSVGRDRYRPPADLKTWLRVSDVTCRFPGCSRAARICEIDHTLDWQHNGTTSHDNLAHLCPAHHHLKHQTDWTVEQRPGRILNWTSPSGRRYSTEPEMVVATTATKPTPALQPV